MTQEKIMLVMQKYGNQIPGEYMHDFNTYLKEASDECISELFYTKIKNKTTTLLFSIFLGGIGVDRFYIGDTNLGITKLILRITAFILSNLPNVNALGVLLNIASWIWCVVDIFITYKSAKMINYEILIGCLRRYRKSQHVQPIEGE